MDVITFPENPKATSGLSILLHGVISLPDATSYDKTCYTIRNVHHQEKELSYNSDTDQSISERTLTQQNQTIRKIDSWDSLTQKTFE